MLKYISWIWLTHAVFSYDLKTDESVNHYKFTRRTEESGTPPQREVDGWSNDFSPNENDEGDIRTLSPLEFQTEIESVLAISRCLPGLVLAGYVQIITQVSHFIWTTRAASESLRN